MFSTKSKMRKIWLYFSFSLIFSLAFSQPKYNVSFESFAPNIESNFIAAFGDGYVMGNYYVDPQNGVFNQVVPSQSCTEGSKTNPLDLVVTMNIEFFCIKVSGNTSSLNHVNPQNSSIVASYPYTGNNTAYLITTDNYVILLGYPINSNAFSADVFDTLTQQWICHVPNIQFAPKSNYTTVSMMHDALIFTVQSMTKELNTSYYYVPCSGNGDYIVTEVNDDKYPIDIWAFNQSTTFLTRSENGDYSYLTAITFDLTGTARIGSAPVNIGPYYSSSKLNDTYYLLPTFNPSQEFLFDMDFIVLTPKLEVKVVLNYQTGLVMTAYFFGTVMLGTNYLVVNDGVTYFYDIYNRNITGVWSSGMPILLGNNSVVNLTDGGYFIQSPGEPIYFISAPLVNGGGVLAADYNDIWSFYTPGFIPQYTWDYCILTRFQLNTSKIIHYAFDKCPVNQLNFDGVLTLQEVFFVDGNPNPFVVYTCTFAYLVVLNQTDILAERVLDINVPTSVTVNLTTMTATILQTDYNNMTVFQMNLTNGHILKSVPISTSMYSGAARLNNNYYMIGHNLNASAGVFSIIDVNNLTLVSNFTFNYPFIRKNYFFSPFFVIGSDQASTNYSAILLWSLPNETILINPQGYTKMTQAGEEPFLQFLVNQNTIYACYYNDVFYYTDTVTVIS